MPKPTNSNIPDMPKSTIHKEGVEKLSRNIYVKKANGWISKEAGAEIARFF